MDDVLTLADSSDLLRIFGKVLKIIKSFNFFLKVKIQNVWKKIPKLS